jgi:hypothetical protein
MVGFSKMKVAVYTCVTNGYDVVSAPIVRTAGVDFLCFNDGSISVPSSWENVCIDGTYSGKDANRYIKILPHLNSRLIEYDLTIYVDGAIEIVGDLTPLIQQVEAASGDIFLYQHPRRSCVYMEARACIKRMKAPIKLTSQLIKKYRSEGLPENLGLFEAGVMIRKPSKEVNRLMIAWWNEYIRWVKRDQLALIYAMWKTGIVIQSLGIPDHRFEHRYFRCKPGHSGDFLLRNFARWIWRPLIGLLIYFKVIKL